MIRCQSASAWAGAYLAELVRQVADIAELPNQNQQNIEPNLTFHPVGFLKG